MSEKQDLRCRHVNTFGFRCERVAVWNAVSDDEEDQTQACADHIGYVLKNDQYMVWPTPVDEFQEALNFWKGEFAILEHWTIQAADSGHASVDHGRGIGYAPRPNKENSDLNKYALTQVVCVAIIVVSAHSQHPKNAAAQVAVAQLAVDILKLASKEDTDG